MAPSRDETDNLNGAVSPDPLTEETTACKKQRLNSSTGTLTSPSSSSASNIPDDSLHAPPLPTLPFELITEILSRLPVKFLMQLQSVSMSWKSLISDPKFAKKHLHVSTTRHHLILTASNPSREFVLITYPLSSVFAEMTATATAAQLEHPLPYRNYYDLIVGSCHGILCFALDEHFALLWNPTISKFTKLPSLENPHQEGSHTIYGFGYDHICDTYKVVAVNCYQFDSTVINSDHWDFKTQVKVHTLGTNVWRRIHDFPFGVSLDESGKFVSGTINWLASKDSSFSSWVIVSLDLEKESYQEVLQPDYGGVNVITVTLGVLRDCLCVLYHSETFSDVWLMKEFGKKASWTKLFRVRYVGDLLTIPYTIPHYISEDDEMLLQSDSELVIYNSRDCTFKNPNIQNIYRCIVAEVYQESLISPCS